MLPLESTSNLRRPVHDHREAHDTQETIPLKVLSSPHSGEDLAGESATDSELESLVWDAEQVIVDNRSNYRGVHISTGGGVVSGLSDSGSGSGSGSGMPGEPKTLLDSKRTYVFIISALAVVCIMLGVYIYISKLLDGSLDVDVYNKQMVVYSMPETYFTRAQGMFADFLAVIGALHYATLHRAAAVRVYFDNVFYVEPERGPNWWAYFFKPVMYLRTPYDWPADSPALRSDLASRNTNRIPTRGMTKDGRFRPSLDPLGRLDPNGAPEEPLKEVHFTKWVARFGKLGSFSQLMTRTSYRPRGQFSKFTYPVHGVDITTSHQLVQQHIKIKHSLALRFDEIRRRLFGEAYVYPYSPPGDNTDTSISGFPRKLQPSSRCPTGRALECKPLPALAKPPSSTEERYLSPVELIKLDGGSPSGVFVIGVHYRGLDKIDAYPYRLAPPDLFRVAISEVIEVYKPAKYLIFVATDTADFIQFAKAHWGEDKVVALDTPRIALRDVEYQRNGIPIPIHKSDKIPKYVKAESAILDMLLLASCNYIVKNRSSLSDTSLAMSPSILNYTFILGADDPVYSTDVRMSIHPEFSDSDFDMYIPGKTPPSKHIRRAGLAVPQDFVPYQPRLVKK